MAKKLSIINNKGGVGKTTTTIILAELLAYLGKRVLCVDLDGQSNLSLALHAYVEDSPAVIQHRIRAEKENVTELFLERYRTKEEVFPLIYSTNLRNVDIIPSSKRFKNIDADVVRNPGNNNILLKKALKALEDMYDYILIDNAPANNILTVNSILASDYILVPVRVEDFSYKGLKETLRDIAYIKEEHDSDVVFLGAFVTQANQRTNVYRERVAQYSQELGDKFLKTSIRRDTQVEQVESKMVPMLEHSKSSNALYDYACLLLEMNILDSESTNLLRESIGA